jgi:hypothetical protein
MVNLLGLSGVQIRDSEPCGATGDDTCGDAVMQSQVGASVSVACLADVSRHYVIGVAALVSTVTGVNVAYLDMGSGRLYLELPKLMDSKTDVLKVTVLDYDGPLVQSQFLGKVRSRSTTPSRCCASPCIGFSGRQGVIFSCHHRDPALSRRT